MRKYRASNRVPFVGFLLLLLIAVLGGAVLGGILWAVDDLAHFYLVIVFPLFAGAIALNLSGPAEAVGHFHQGFFGTLLPAVQSDRPGAMSLNWAAAVGG